MTVILPDPEVPIPKTIDILGRVYTIHESWDEYPARTTSSPNVQGTCSWMRLCIYINPDHALVNRKSTLIHEILHGLLSFAKDPEGDGHKNKFRDVHELEEYICASLDDGLGYVLSKNPALLEFLGQ